MKIKSGFVLEEVGNSFVAVAVGDRALSTNAMIKLNSTGAFLWNLLCEKDLSEEELIAALLQEYDVDPELARRDISAFAEKLRANGLVDE